MSFWKKTKQAITHYSGQALAVATAIPPVWYGLPEETKALVPAEYALVISGVVGAIGFIGKLVPQGNAEEKAATRIIDEVKPVIVEELKTRAVNTVKNKIKEAITK